VIYTAEKPVVIALMGERLIQEAVEHFRAAHVPEYRFPERAAEALAVLAQRAEYLAANGKLAGETARLDGIDFRKVQEVLTNSPMEGWLSQEQAFALLEAYGIPAHRPLLARTSAEAEELADQLGYPVALKIASPDIPHKSDAGGVLLDLRDALAVQVGFDKVLASCQAAQPGASIAGVYVQRMAADGQEVIVGAIQDPQFGPLVMFGSGGVEVEGLKDVQFALAPLGEAEAKSLLDKTWAGQKLRGFRNLPQADRQAVTQTLLRLAQMAADFPQLAEIEINPLRVMETGDGAWAVDVRVRLVKDSS
jgi:acetyltransferase